MKLLLYCTKNRWRLFFDKVKQVFTLGKVKSNNDLNGKIIAECDFEVEEITYAPNPSAFDRANFSPKEWGYDYQEKYGGLSNEELLKHSCLTNKELSDYLNTPTNDKKTFCEDTFGYAIHIKNLHIFDKPRELSDYDDVMAKPLNKAPQNMMYAYNEEDKEYKEYILVSIKPEWLCKILNGYKTIEVRKKVLKEMM